MMDAKDFEISEFRLVTFAKERAQVLADLSTHPTTVFGLTDDNTQFQFLVRRVKDELIIAVHRNKPVREVKKDEKIALVFGLGDGQFYFKTQVSFLGAGEIYFPLGEELFRLQRRNNFRAQVSGSKPVTFQLRSLKTEMVNQTMKAADISAGGIRLLWPAKEAQKLQPEDQVSGLLNLPNGLKVEVFGTVKHIWSKLTDDFALVGIQFHNLSSRDEQTLLFVCMAMHRDSIPLGKIQKV